MTHQPLTKAEREGLRKIIAEARDVCHCGQYVDEHTESDNHAALAMDTQESDRLTAASLEAMPRLLADLDAAEANYARCAAASQDVLKEMVSVTAQRDRAEAERDALKAKLAALVEVGERWVTSNEPIDAGNPFVDHDLKAAIAAARGGAS